MKEASPITRTAAPIDVPAAAPAPMIRLCGLSKIYGRVRAVDGMDLEVRRGEIFAFLGPNGAGKTTTMRMIAGLIKPTAGSIEIDGVNLAADPFEVKRRLGYIPDRPFLYEKLTGREFLHFVASLYDQREEEEAARANEMFDLFELAAFADELIENYSHGMKQRLTMAAAFIHRPSLLVVDEPMVGLDPKGARLVKTIFRAARDQRKTTIFMSTHSIPVAEELADRVSIIADGKIIALGTVDELKRRVGAGEAALEQVFLRLTGGEDVGEVGRIL